MYCSTCLVVRQDRLLQQPPTMWTWSESGASDFAKYRIYVLTSAKTDLSEDTWKLEVTSRSTLTATLSDLDESRTYYVYVTAVDAQGNEIVNTVAPETLNAVVVEEEGLTTLEMGLIGGIVALAIIAGLLAVMLMRKPKTPKPETPQEKKEE